MRLILFICILALGPGCACTKKSGINKEQLNGTWIPVKQEFGGTMLPKASFENQKLTINDSTYTFIAESVDKGVLSYKDGKMDIYGKEGVNIGEHFTTIYKFENEELMVCYNLKGDSYPEAFETKDKPMYFLSVYKKEK